MGFMSDLTRKGSHRAAKVRFSAVILGMAMLGGCTTLGDISRSVEQPSQRFLAGAERGASPSITSRLSEADKQEIRMVALRTLNDPMVNNRVPLRLPSGQRMSIVAGPAYLVDLDGGTTVKTPVNLETETVLEPKAGDFVTTTNSNVRSGPSTEFTILTTLNRNTRVRALGKAENANWLLVARGDEALGYIFGNLLKPVGGGDLLLAGGSSGRLRICRELTYLYPAQGAASRGWYNGACRIGKGNWLVEGGEPLPTS